MSGMICGECAELVVNVRPAQWGMPEFIAVPEWSHSDCTALCPTMGSDGYAPSVPVPGGEPVTLSVEQVAVLDSIDQNYGPYSRSEILDMVGMCDMINESTDNEIEWATAAAIFAYFGRLTDGRSS